MNIFFKVISRLGLAVGGAVVCGLAVEQLERTGDKNSVLKNVLLGSAVVIGGSTAMFAGIAAIGAVIPESMTYQTYDFEIEASPDFLGSDRVLADKLLVGAYDLGVQHGSSKLAQGTATKLAEIIS